jgi:tellurite methyltransferase
MRNPWAREYAKTPDRYIWGKAPSRFARELTAFVPPGGRILDLGCGEGRDSVYFAFCGSEVTGLDISEAGLEKAKRLAEERGVAVRWLCRSMLDVPVTGRFDLVYSCGAIHHVPRDDRPRLFKRLKALTRGRGLNAHVVFTDLRVYVEKDEEIDYFSAGELAEAYAGWLVIRHEDGLVPCAQDGVQHLHSVERLVTTPVAQRVPGLRRAIPPILLTA